MKIIKINGDDSSVLSVGLKDILSCINQGEKIAWGLMWLSASAKLNDGQSIVDLENRINKSKDGMKIVWEDSFYNWSYIKFYLKFFLI